MFVEFARPIPALCNSAWRVDVYPLIVEVRLLPVLGRLFRAELIDELNVEIADAIVLVVGSQPGRGRASRGGRRLPQRRDGGKDMTH